MIGGLIGAGSGFKKSFVSCWILLINFSFSIYISVFLAPLAVTLLEIPGLTAGYKNAIAVAGIFLIVNFILQKITEQIIPNPDINFNLPPIAQIFSIAAGFLSGLMIAGILLYCFMQTPFVSGLSQKKELRATARNTMMGVVYTLNVFSFQSLSPEAEKELQAIRLIPKKKTASSGAQDEDDSQERSKPAENKPAEGSVKKDSTASSDQQPAKPAENKKTE
ncbi:MAG: CvpA family protein [Lentisphaerae bacterium]|nr:CvpA family protein [Lentisphaerota bacterium]